MTYSSHIHGGIPREPIRCSRVTRAPLWHFRRWPNPEPQQRSLRSKSAFQASLPCRACRHLLATLQLVAPAQLLQQEQAPPLATMLIVALAVWEDRKLIGKLMKTTVAGIGCTTAHLMGFMYTTLRRRDGKASRKTGESGGGRKSVVVGSTIPAGADIALYCKCTSSSC